MGNLARHKRMLETKEAAAGERKPSALSRLRTRLFSFLVEKEHTDPPRYHVPIECKGEETSPGKRMEELEEGRMGLYNSLSAATGDGSKVRRMIQIEREAAGEADGKLRAGLYRELMRHALELGPLLDGEGKTETLRARRELEKQVLGLLASEAVAALRAKRNLEERRAGEEMP